MLKIITSILLVASLVHGGNCAESNDTLFNGKYVINGGITNRVISRDLAQAIHAMIEFVALDMWVNDGITILFAVTYGYPPGAIGQLNPEKNPLNYTILYGDPFVGTSRAVDGNWTDSEFLEIRSMTQDTVHNKIWIADRCFIRTADRVTGQVSTILGNGNSIDNFTSYELISFAESMDSIAISYRNNDVLLWVSTGNSGLMMFDIENRVMHQVFPPSYFSLSRCFDILFNTESGTQMMYLKSPGVIQKFNMSTFNPSSGVFGSDGDIWKNFTEDLGRALGRMAINNQLNLMTIVDITWQNFAFAYDYDTQGTMYFIDMQTRELKWRRPELLLVPVF